MVRRLTLAVCVSSLALAACADDNPGGDDAMAEESSMAGESGLATANQSVSERRRAEAGGAQAGQSQADQAMAGGRTVGDEGALSGSPGETRGETTYGSTYDDGDSSEGGGGAAPPTVAVQNAAQIVSGFSADALADFTGDAEDYVRNVQLANLFLVEAGGIATERGGEPEIRALGQEIAQAHQDELNALREAIDTAGLGMEPPRQIDADRRRLLEALRGTDAVNFDPVFIRQQTAIHGALNALHQAYGRTGAVEGLTAFAQTSAARSGERLERMRNDHEAALAPN